MVGSFGSRLLARMFVVLVIAVLVGSCGGDSGDDNNGVAVTVTEGPTSVLSAIVDFESEEAGFARIRAVADDHEVVTPLAAGETEGASQLPLVGLRADREYKVTVEMTDADGEVVGSGSNDFTTPELPAFIPDVEMAVADTTNMAEGLTMFTATPWALGEEVPDSTPGLLMAVDSDGEVVWYHNIPFGISDARLLDDDSVRMIFALWGIFQVDSLGVRLATYEVDPAAGKIGPDARALGSDGAQDAEPAEETEGVPNPATILTSSQYGLRSLHHAATGLPNGNILSVSTTTDGYQISDEFRKELCPDDDGDWVVADEVIIEFTPEGEIVNEWLLSDIMSPEDVPGTEMCVTGGQIADEMLRDWAHINAVVYDETRNALIVSNRHTSTVLAFRYADDDNGASGDFLWMLGPNDVAGTLPLDGEPQYYQHAPQVQDDGSLLLYDNGNFRPGTGHPNPMVRSNLPEADAPFSRAVRYEIDDSSDDPADWSATQVWEHRIDDRNGNPLFAPFLGDADTLANGNVLITHGGINQFSAEDARSRIVEVDPESGDTVMDLRVQDQYVSYRSERIPGFYNGPVWQGNEDGIGGEQ